MRSKLPVTAPAYFLQAAAPSARLTDQAVRLPQAMSALKLERGASARSTAL